MSGGRPYPRPWYWYCPAPACGFAITDTDRRRFRRHLPCPRCGQRDTSQFYPGDRAR